jgi:carboxyl-terminal processing protease
MKRILFLIAVCLTVGTAAAQRGDRRTAAAVQKLTQFASYLGGTYVDTLDMGTLVDGAIEEMLGQLDPHSAYVPAEEMKSVEESFNANFEGIGIEFNVLKDTILVVNTIPGGPSEQVGLLPNDRIVTVADTSVVGTRQTDVPKILRGPKGTVVNLGVVRPGVTERLAFRIVRDKIPIYTVDAAYKTGSTGYIKVNRFAATTNSELQQAITGLGTIDGLILDLRGNGGGYLDQAVYVSNTFLQSGSLVVSTEGRMVPPEKLTANRAPSFPRGKVIVLVDEFSASASEIVAGAVQDWDRGLIIGRPTFGKGLVQRQFPLLDGSAVRITVARYHTPTGRVIQRPYEQGKSQDYYAEFNSRFTVDSLATLHDSLKYSTLRSQRTVYGGGGITPDLIVARDTTGYTGYWSALNRLGVITEYVIGYMDRNRASLEARYPDFEAYNSGFTVDQTMLDSLASLGTQRGVEKHLRATMTQSSDSLQKNEPVVCLQDTEILPQENDSIDVEAEIAESTPLLRAQIKALIAQKLWTTTEYYRVVNAETDSMFAKAVEVMQNWNEYSAGILDAM